jgi:6-phosphogluconolactonase
MEQIQRIRHWCGVFPRWLPAALLGAMLPACGGGGGGGGNNSPPPPPPPTYSVGGTVNGLAGTGLVLQNNAGGNLAVAAAGSFTFASRLTGGAAYNVTVSAQPVNPSQTCAVTGGTGTVASADVNSITVSCTTNTYTVGGSVSGLTGSGLALSLNGGTELLINGNGDFVFPTAVNSGGAYEVSLAGPSRAPAQSCVLGSASGAVTAANVTSVSVVCTTRYGQYALVTDQVAGTLSSFAVDSFTGRMKLRDFKTTENGAVGVTVDASGGLVYVANQGTDEITAYSLDKATGGLSQIPGSPFTAGDAPQKVQIDPSGQYLVAANLLSGNLSVYSRTQTGALTPVAGSPFALNSAARPVDVAFDPSGRFLFATDSNAQGVWVFSMNAATGALLPVAGSPFVNGVQNPVDLEITGDGRFLVVANSLSDNISVFAVNPANGALAPVAGSPFAAGLQPRALALDPSGRFLYAANGNSDNLYTYSIDRVSGVLAEVGGGRVSTGDLPSAVRVDPTGQWLYVTHLNSSTVGSYRIDTTSGIPALQRLHATRRSPSAMALTQGTETLRIESRHAYVVNHSGDTLSELDVDDATGSLDLQALAVATGDGPIDVTVHPGSRFVYVVNRLAETIQAYTVREDGGLDVNGPAIASGNGTVQLVVEGSGRFAYGADIDSGSISIYDIDAVTGRLTARAGTVPVALQLQSLALDPAGQYLFAGNLMSPQLSVFRIDVAGGALTAVGTPLALANNAYALGMNEAGTRLYVASAGGDSVSTFAFNRATAALTALGPAVSVGDAPRDLASNPVTGDVYVANYNTDTISRLSTLPSGELAFVANHAAQDGPVDLAIEDDGRFLFAVNGLQGSVTSYDIAGGTPQQVDLVSVGAGPLAITLRETVTLLPAGP